MDLDVQWSPQIGDPSFMGWFTVFAYFAAAVLAGITARAVVRLPAAERGRQRRVWWAVAALLFALGINKQLDLQSWFTAVGRAVARKQGWFDERRSVQYTFSLAFASAASFALGLMLGSIRRRWREYGLLLFGVGFTLTFIALRAISFHHFEELLGYEIAGAEMNWVLELSGIGIIALAAVVRMRYARRNALAA
jgi:hypothetical protein